MTAPGLAPRAHGPWHGRIEISHPPGLDCLIPGHLHMTMTQPGAFPTLPGQIPTATWCLWCGGGVSNEELPEETS